MGNATIHFFGDGDLVPTTILAQASQLPLIDMYLQRLSSGSWWSWRAMLELLLIGVVIYSILRFLEGTRGARLLQAVLVILVAILGLALFARVLGLDHILVLYPFFVGGAFVVTLVVFQPELRRGLMRIGESLTLQTRTAESSRLIEPVVRACANMSRRKIGAIIAIERRTPMGAMVEAGIEIDSETSQELIETIFWPGSALHDLGVIISHGRIAAAGCEFPTSDADPGNQIIGSRHRAAIGISLETDALVVVVSEETGTISIANRGRLERQESPEMLRESLAANLLGPESVAPTIKPDTGKTDAESTQPKGQAETGAPAANSESTSASASAASEDLGSAAESLANTQTGP
ncbi:MAG: TIGR00159 family protein [Planctomycetes bacterium]|nr:TIGR00159 family protein [Planctomycetota bacterium]